MMAVVTAVSVCPTCAVPVIAGWPVAGLLTTAVATWNSAESPYMGRAASGVAELVLLRGPLPLLEELGRPTAGLNTVEPSACDRSRSVNFSVPSCVQPVRGELDIWAVSGPSLPDAFLSLASSSQDSS